MKLGGIMTWAEEHPAASIAIGLVFVLFVLWLFGAFKGSAKQSDGGASNMAAAYYAAEAQQAVVGGQIQVATIQANRDTAINAAQTDAAVKLGKIQAKAATTINTTNAGVAVQNINAQVAMNASNNATAAQIAETQTRGSLLSEFFHSILPTEIANMGQTNFSLGIPGFGTFSQSRGLDSPTNLLAAGFSQAQINRMYGL